LDPVKLSEMVLTVSFVTLYDGNIISSLIRKLLYDELTFRINLVFDY